jgi:hypothetical protein
MVLTGYNLRNIYPQDNVFNYLAEISCSNTTGVCQFGFSGNSGSFGFLLSGSKVFVKSASPATVPNYFIDSYLSNDSLFFSGNVGPASHDGFINSNPKFLGLNKSGGYYNYFYVSSDNVETDISLKINGSLPNYSYNPFESFYSGQNIPITIVNSGSYPFKIFSGSIGNSYFSINGVSNVNVTGSYTFNLTSNNFSPLSQGIPINLYTNFGNVVLDFTASGIPNITGDFYLLFGPNKNIAVNAQQNSYTISLKSYTGMELYVSLSYQSGITGDFYKLFEIDNDYTGSASGWITGSGNISSFVTGQNYKYNTLLDQNEYGTGSGNVSSFIYSSGNVTDEFSTTLIGLGSGLISYLTGVTGYGVFTFNGVVTAAGGILTRYDLTGLGSGMSEYGIYFGNTTSGVGSIFAPFTGSVSELTGIFGTDNYETVDFQTSNIFFTGEISKFYSISGLAWATGGILTGKLQGEFGYNFEPGVYTFLKGWTGIGSGLNAIISSFDPVEYEYSSTGTTGIIGGLFITGLNADGCDFSEPYFIPTGIPSQIYDDNGLLVNPLNIFLLSPLNLSEYTGDNSSNINSRTKISRNGLTPSGTGYFDNVFRGPFYNSGIWTEYLTGYNNTITGDKSKVVSINANPFLYQGKSITGYFTISGTYTGFQNFEWNGKVTGNFIDYKTTIYSLDNGGVNKTYYNSYNFSMNLKTGRYGFLIQPSSDINGDNPFISFPESIDVYSFQNNVEIPFQLSKTTDSTVEISLEYVDGTARNGVNYTSQENKITFTNGIASIISLNIPIYNINSNLFFGIKIKSIDGGYISNKNDILNKTININIKTPPSKNDNYCCGQDIPDGKTGIAQVDLCNNLLGNQRFTSGNGIFNTTINLTSPIPEGYTLPFYTSFDGLNDRFKMDAYTTNGETISIYDTDYINDTNYYVYLSYGAITNSGQANRYVAPYPQLQQVVSAPPFEVSYTPPFTTSIDVASIEMEVFYGGEKGVGKQVVYGNNWSYDTGATYFKVNSTGCFDNGAKSYGVASGMSGSCGNIYWKNLGTYINQLTTLPANTYAVNLQVFGGDDGQLISNRPPWDLRLKCNIDSDGNIYDSGNSFFNYCFGSTGSQRLCLPRFYLPNYNPNPPLGIYGSWTITNPFNQQVRLIVTGNADDAIYYNRTDFSAYSSDPQFSSGVIISPFPQWQYFGASRSGERIMNAGESAILIAYDGACCGAGYDFTVCLEPI